MHVHTKLMMRNEIGENKIVRIVLFQNKWRLFMVLFCNVSKSYPLSKNFKHFLSTARNLSLLFLTLNYLNIFNNNYSLLIDSDQQDSNGCGQQSLMLDINRRKIYIKEMKSLMKILF